MFCGAYLEWNQKRIKKIVDIYGYKFFFLKKLLDLGCGQGDISVALQRLGADVTAADARKEHIKIINKKFHGIKAITTDLDTEWIFANKKFDIVLDLSLLHCIKDYEAHLRNICKITNHLVLEANVCDSNDPYKCINVRSGTSIYDSSFNGLGCIPSAAAIERTLLECGMTFRRYDDSDLNTNEYSYDWTEKNNNEYDTKKRRMWTCIKNNSAIQFAKKINAVSPNIISNNTPPVMVNKGINAIVDSKIAVGSAIPQPQPLPILKKQPANIIHNQLANGTKVAIVISGHMRTFQNNYKSFTDNVIINNSNNADVFIHTWDTLGSPASKLNSDAGLLSYKTEDMLPQINAILNPKKIIIEKYSNAISSISTLNNQARLIGDDRNYLHNKDLISYGSMLYSLKSVGKMLDDYERENNMEYDIVIRLRPDLYFTSGINITNWNFKEIHVPYIGAYYKNGMNDQFAVGGSNAMKIYLSLFDHLVGYINRRECMIRPEVFLRHHLLKNGIHVKDELINFNIIRPNGKVTTQTRDGQYWSK